jgi:hypothetical protein
MTLSKEELLSNNRVQLLKVLSSSDGASYFEESYVEMEVKNRDSCLRKGSKFVGIEARMDWRAFEKVGPLLVLACKAFEPFLQISSKVDSL